MEVMDKFAQPLKDKEAQYKRALRTQADEREVASKKASNILLRGVLTLLG